jgi:hypothetical protein
MNDWDKILDNFARKCKGGAPDMTNPRHLALLRESLIKFGWNENATNEFIGNLRETKDKSDDSWWTKKTPAQQAKYIKDHPGSKKAKEVKKKEKGEEKKKPNNHQGQNLESINSIDGDAKQGGLEHKIKAPGDPKGAAAANEISQGFGVAAINELGEDATDEQITEKICESAGGTKLGDKFLCPPDTTDKKDYMKSVVNSARAKHRRNQEVIAEEGMNPESTTTSHVWGSKQSLVNTVNSLSEQGVTEVNGIPLNNDPKELYVHDKNGKMVRDKNGQPIAKPVELDKNGNPVNYAQVILNGGEGDNPTDTMFVMVDDSVEPPKAVIMHDSDKMTSGDLQGNSGPKKTLDNGVEHFKKKWKDDTEQTEKCGTGTKRACTKSERAEESANNTKKKIDETKAKIKSTISGQATKFTNMSSDPRTAEKTQKMDNLLRMIKEGKPFGISSSPGKYHKILQKRYAKQLEEFKKNNPNATQEDLDYEMVRLFGEEYEKTAPYASYTLEEFRDLKRRSNPKYKGDDRIEPTIPDPKDPTKTVPNPDYIPSDAKQPTGDMQTVAVRTMEREDEMSPDGEKTVPVLTKTTLKELFDDQTTALNDFREEMNEVEDGAGDDFFVEQMIKRFHFGISEGHASGGVPPDRINLVMGRNESGIRYRKNSDGSVTIFKRKEGSNYEEIDENGDVVKGGETASSLKKGNGLEKGDTATMGNEENFRECLGLDKDDTPLEESISVSVVTAGNTNQAEALIYDRNGDLIARQTIRSKTGPGGSIADTIQFEEEFQNCLQLASLRNSK